MAQRSLHEYFPLVRLGGRLKRITFLHLPYAIRRRIYLAAGLSAKRTISLNYHPPVNEEGDIVEVLPGFDIDPNLDLDDIPSQEAISRRTISISHFLEGPPYPKVQLDRLCSCQFGPQNNWTRFNCDSAPLPHALLYVSKLIRDEVSSIFWSENSFSVCCNEIGGLSVIQNIPESRFVTISSLVIRLNCRPSCCDCENEICQDWAHPKCQGAYGAAPLHRENVNFQTLLVKWKAFCHYLKSRIRPHQMELFLICDSADVQTAEKLVKPLLQLPFLRQYAIRLSKLDTDGDERTRNLLQQFAANTALQATGRLAMQPFRLLDLANEIQLKIFEFTDLIAPSDIQWCPTGRKYPYGASEDPGILLEYRLLSSHLGLVYSFNHLTCCGRCTSASDSLNCAVEYFLLLSFLLTVQSDTKKHDFTCQSAKGTYFAAPDYSLVEYVLEPKESKPGGHRI